MLHTLLLKNLVNLNLNFDARLKKANLVSKTDFDNKLISCNKKITSLNVFKMPNKTK